MSYNSAADRRVAPSTWLALNDVTLEIVLSIALLATTVSLTLAASGMEELLVPVALAAMAAIVVGFALSRSFDSLRADGLPVVE
ncbi:hypothetical protein [Halosimplex sp. J119]